MTLYHHNTYKAFYLAVILRLYIFKKSNKRASNSCDSIYRNYYRYYDEFYFRNLKLLSYKYY